LLIDTVVCLTLAKWETVSGRFGGYLISQLMTRAGLLKNEKFIAKGEFKQKGFLGSGGIGRFRDTLWAAVGPKKIARLSPQKRAELANDRRSKIHSELAKP